MFHNTGERFCCTAAPVPMANRISHPDFLFRHFTFPLLSSQYLDENKQLILAILDNQNLGKMQECAQSVILPTTPSFLPPSLP